ncbi:hypothetical protein M569_13045, partial [Genlisea aurea]
ATSATAAAAAAQFLFSGSRSFARLPHHRQYRGVASIIGRTSRSSAGNGGAVRCTAVAADSEAETKKKKKSSYEILTLTTWLLTQEKSGLIDAELTIVISSISMACKQIASLVQRAGISNLTGVQGAVNVQGEDQKKLDVVSNEVFSNCLKSSGRTGIIASEEEDVPVAVEESFSGNYIVVFDPLDGSSNIDAAVSTGSIFGIYSPNDECFADSGDDSTVTQT